MVIDTNIVLDMWVYQDPSTPALLTALQEGAMQWLATPPMREELLRVLDYPHIVERRNRDGVSAQEVLSHFDRWVNIHAIAPKAPYVCKDTDDQKFIDLALAAGVGVRFIVDLEGGKPTVRLEQVLRVVDALGGSLALTGLDAAATQAEEDRHGA